MSHHSTIFNVVVASGNSKSETYSFPGRAGVIEYLSVRFYRGAENQLEVTPKLEAPEGKTADPLLEFAGTGKRYLTGHNETVEVYPERAISDDQNLKVKFNNKGNHTIPCKVRVIASTEG